MDPSRDPLDLDPMEMEPFLRQVVLGWDKGLFSPTQASALLRSAVTDDPPSLTATAWLALRAIILQHPSTRQGSHETPS